MKNLLLLAVVSMTLSTAALAADTCRAIALGAAEDVYDNAPHTTSVKTIALGRDYRVSVGRGNPEDGEHYYNVSFPNGCESAPVVTEIESN